GDRFLYGSRRPLGNDEIWRVNADGTGRTQFAYGHFDPGRIHFASNGRLYALDYDGIYEYSLVPESAPIQGIFSLVALMMWNCSKRRRVEIGRTPTSRL
ncbi:MAG TPA: hypothetical protein VIY86_03115, partial [Pirellulaceae bacterium]